MSAIRHQFFSSPVGKSPQRTRRSGGRPISSRQTAWATSSVVYVGRRQPVRRDAEVAGQELPRPVDRLALEVVAEAPVAEHLEERVVARRPADLLEVVVLAGDPQAALVVDGAGVVALLGAGQRVLELDHARVREQQRLVARGHEAGAGHDRMAALGEELEEPRRRISAAGRYGIRGLGRRGWPSPAMVPKRAGPARGAPARAGAGAQPPVPVRPRLAALLALAGRRSRATAARRAPRHEPAEEPLRAAALTASRSASSATCGRGVAGG